MNNLNVCSFICKDANRKSQIIENIVNEIELPVNEKVHLYVITFLNGIEFDDTLIYLDYFINYIPDSDDDIKYMYLFSTEFSKLEEEDDSASNGKSKYENYMFEISYEEIDISFPNKGTYELEVFKLEERPKGLARERYRDYREKKKKPNSVYNFVVK